MRLEEAKVKWIAGEEAACSGGEETDRQRRGREGPGEIHQGRVQFISRIPCSGAEVVVRGRRR